MTNLLPHHAMITRLVQICERDARIEAAMLYGSFATGEADEYSDIDVMLYFDDDHLADIDQHEWLKQAEPVEFSYINEFGNRVAIFKNLIRGEFHFDPASDIVKLEEFQGLVWFPSLEKTILVDKSGQLKRHLEKLIGSSTSHNNAQEADNLIKSFLNWFLFGINVQARGEFARSHEILRMVQEVLLRMIRLVEGVDEHWITPTKSLELEISPEMYRRYQGCTSALDSVSLEQAYQSCFDLGRELITEMANQFDLSIPEELLDRLAERFSGQKRYVSPLN
jgi:lincosamide nucleotidyltransferase